MALFLSTFINAIDRKGRVSVPAPFRAALGSQNGIVVFRSYKAAALEGSGIDLMERLGAGLDRLELFSDDRDDLAATIFADCHQLPIDGEGRVVLPKDLLTFAEIADKAAFVGRGPTFQIWEPSAFARFQAEARARSRERKLTLKLEPPTPGHPAGERS
ncbi:MAG: division/cell wall cluster transcriptional repressor MraZ [Alphaproteobacteria bacterium]